MANRDDHLTYYREFFENFAKTVNPNDQLPVKLGTYKLINLEVVGGVIDWTTQYLTQKKCPPSLIAPLIQIIIDETRKACKKDPVACGFNTAENAYEPLKLMQAVMAKTNEICLRYLDNSMLCSLPPPGPPFNVVSVSAARNKRIKMEDKHVVINDLNTMFNIQDASPSSYYAIFDGHAGLDAAAYSAAHLHQFLAESKHFATDPKQALRDAFCKTDSLFVDKCTVDRRFSSGTTAVCALHRPKEKKLYIAWVGDSQALLVNQGRVLQCVHPHKPCREDEKLRIENEGGFVSFWGTWRVMGQLAVSRAIGDATYKPYVTAIPDIREIPLDGGEDFLILACDGLWDFLSEDDTAKTVYNMVCDDPDKPDLVGERLVQLSKESGSTDNISVIVVFLRDTHVIAAEARVWGAANRNDGTSLTTSRMDTSLDNANNTNTNPFANSNGAEKNDGLLLNLSERFNKQNGGSDLLGSSNPACGIDLFNVGSAEKKRSKSNGKRLASEFEDDEDGDDLDDDDDEDEDLGPETDVDAVDDLLSGSIEKAKAMAEGIVNNNPEGSFNPFVEKHEVEKAAMEIELDLQKQQTREFDEERSPREETPTPPADAVHDVGGLVDNAADSGEDSDDEWNYIKGEEANKENISPVQPDQEVADILEEAAEQNQNAEIDPDEETMSQLNPNAAEFVPVSPTRSVPSPSPCLNLLNDPVVAQSPKRPAADVDIFLPADRQEFENEVKLRPSEVDDVDDGSSLAARAAACTNGHDTGDATDGDRKKHPSSNTTTSSAVDLMENLLNGKNLDEIPEFQPSPSNKNFSSEVGQEAPASAPVLLPSSGSGGAASANDEFHFGPNAAPFSTPTRSLLTSQSSALDQSEAGYSTRAVYGDDTSATLETSFEQDIADLEALAEEEGEDKENDEDGFLSKEQRQQQRDPMSMSFYQDDSQTSDVLDLNKVQVLPDNIDDFLSRPGDDPPQQSKWEEHDQKPSSPFDYKDDDLTLDNEARLIQTTDLDKPTSGSRNFDDEKELESPATPNNDRLLLLGTTEEEEEDEVPQQRGAGDFVNLEAPKVDDLIAVSPVPYAGEREAVRSPEVPIAEGTTAVAKSPVPSPVVAADDNIISAAPTSPLLQTIEDHFAATSPIPQLNAEPQNTETSSLLEPQKVSTLGEHGDEDNNEGQKSPPLCSTPSSMGSQISCDELEPREPIYEDNNAEEDLLRAQEPTRIPAPDVLLPSQEDNLLSNVGRDDETLAQPEASSAAAESGNIDDEQREKTGDDLLCGWVPPVPSRRTKSPDVVEDLLSRQQQYQHNEAEQREDNLLCELTGSRSPLEPERKDELSIESSHDDVTSSVKDDLAAPSSPVPSPLPQDHHGEVPEEEPLTQEVTSTTTINTPNTNEDLKEATLLPSPTREHQTSFCPMVSTPKSAVTETESVATTADVNSFLNRSLMGSDVSSLMSLSNNEQQQTSVLQPEEIAGAQTTTNATSEFEAEVFGTTATGNVPIAEQQLPVLEPQHVQLKTETIQPEYAEQTLLLSSEPLTSNDRDQEASSGPSPAEEPTKEPAPTTTETPIITPSAPPQEEVEEASNEIETSTVVATTAAAAAAAVGVASAVAGATKVGTDKKTSAASASTKTKTPLSSASAKKTTTAAAAVSKGKPSASPRTTSGKSAPGPVATTTGPSNKVGANKTPTTATSKASARPITRPGLGGARTTANVEGSGAPLAKKTSAPALGASKTSSTTATAATGTRPGTTSAPAARPRAAASRPTTATAAAGKTGGDKKPQLNGGDNAKARPHSTSTSTSAFRRSTETSATSRAATTTSSARTVTSSTTSTSVGTKSSPTKPSVPRTSLTSSAAAPAKSSPRTSTGGAGSTAAAPKPSPNVLGSRVGAAASRSTTTKPTTLKTTNSTATKTTYSPKPRPASSTATTTTTTTSTTAAKPRVPLSKTTTTTTTAAATSNNRTLLAPSVDAQKQIKDSVNKLTAATRTTTASSTRTSSSTAAASRTTTSTHKTESKTAGNRTTVSKTTSHTKTSTASLGAGNNSNKKPQEIVRNIKTKTTKIEKPQQIPNGVSSTIVTEQITTTIVNDAVSANNEINQTAVNVNNDDDTPLLVKDNSPVDNKLIVETATTNNAAADLTNF